MIEGRNIGFLYDIGSSSAQEHYKFRSRDNLGIIFQPKESEGQSDRENSSDSSVRSKPKLLPVPDKSKSNPKQQTHQHEGRRVSSGFGSARPMTQKGKSTYVEFIKNTLKESNLNHLFVVLSHPDKDHINYVDEGVLPLGVSTIFLLGGAWLGDAASNNSIDLSADVKKVFDYIVKREKEQKNIHLELPYYWNYTNYLNLINRIRKGDYQRLYKEFSMWGQAIFRVDERRRNLEEVVDEIINYYNLPAVTDHFQEVTGNEARTLMLRKIIFWSFNHHTGDANDQSMVISCTNDKLKMSYVLTGDAEDTSFEKIRLREEGEEGRDTQDILRRHFGITDENHLVFLMCPHHGSENNISTKMLYLFKPDVIGVSGGNGGQFRHPSRLILDHINEHQEALKGKEELGISLRFWKRYAYYKSHQEYFSAFFEHNNLPLCTQAKRKYIPILSTNIEGTLKINATNIYNQPGARYLTVANKEYKVDLKRHIASTDKLHANEIKLIYKSIQQNKAHPQIAQASGLTYKKTTFKDGYNNQQECYLAANEKSGLLPVKTGGVM